MMASGSRSRQGGFCMEDMLKIVTSLYPDLQSRTYAVPPAHFNRVPYVRKIVPGTGLSAQVIDSSPGDAPPKHDAPPENQPDLPAAPQSMFNQQSQTPIRVRESDFRDDFAQNHVMHNLQALGDKQGEVMFILSRLHFGNYLNQPAYAATTKQFPLPSDLDNKIVKYSDGEPDFVLINRQYGILIGELKSVSKSQAANKEYSATQDSVIAKRVKQAIKQLDRSAIVVRHLVNDVAPDLAVRKALFLPNISSDQLKKILLKNPDLEQETCTSLGAANAAEAANLSCCSDQLSDPKSYWNVNDDVLSRLTIWWKSRTSCTVKTELTDRIYTEIVTRFVGPASSVNVQCNFSPRVEVRTRGQAVAELGWRLAQLILTQEQLDLLNRDPRLVCITGPPGTGKTVVLVLQAVRWIQQGRDVHVVSSRRASRAVSILSKCQINMTATKNTRADLRQPGKVFLHNYDIINRGEDVTRAVKELAAAAGCDGKLCVILDEAIFDRSTKQGPRHKELVSQLIDALPKLHFWSACILYDGIPEQLQTEMLTTPLRCAPVVVRELQPAISMYYVYDYSDMGIPSHGDGPSVIRLSHQGKGHVGKWPDECPQCGCNVAAELRSLGVGNTDNGLKYRDVFILTRSSELHDNEMDDSGNIRSLASGIVLGLRTVGMQVHVLGRQSESQQRSDGAMEDIALAKTDRIVVAHGSKVTGLERKIVVTLEGHFEGADDGSAYEDIDSSDKLIAVARCTTQLITVTVPTSDKPEANAAPLARANSHSDLSDSKSMTGVEFNKRAKSSLQNKFGSVNNLVQAMPTTFTEKKTMSRLSRLSRVKYPYWEDKF